MDELIILHEEAIECLKYFDKRSDEYIKRARAIREGTSKNHKWDNIVKLKTSSVMSTKVLRYTHIMKQLNK